MSSHFGCSINLTYEMTSGFSLVWAALTGWCTLNFSIYSFVRVILELANFNHFGFSLQIFQMIYCNLSDYTCPPSSSFLMIFNMKSYLFLVFYSTPSRSGCFWFVRNMICGIHFSILFCMHLIYSISRSTISAFFICLFRSPKITL